MRFARVSAGSEPGSPLRVPASTDAADHGSRAGRIVAGASPAGSLGGGGDTERPQGA
ncbi:hypothetical protein [Candidatus Poriferisodalis sp.]|uniref:hypothetical protein n=1 Tax=Candidatus Poriferisodalis sp. TaxID=3101277 RepID=UPI003B027C67